MNEPDGVTASYDKRLFIPPQIEDAEVAYELLSAWVYSGGIASMSRSGTFLDSNPAMWGEVLASIAQNVASSAEADGFDRTEMLKKMKESLDRQWDSMNVTGTYYPPPPNFPASDPYPPKP